VVRSNWVPRSGSKVAVTWPVTGRVGPLPETEETVKSYVLVMGFADAAVQSAKKLAAAKAARLQFVITENSPIPR